MLFSLISLYSKYKYFNYMKLISKTIIKIFQLKFKY